MTCTSESIGYKLLLLAILFILFLITREVYVYLKSIQKGPITLTPVIPFPQDNLQIFKGTDNLKNVVPEANIRVCDKNTDAAEVSFLISWEKYVVFKTINEFMASTFELHNRLPDKYEVVKSNRRDKHYRMLPKISVPNNARTISIKMDGFEHGEKCHDFVPIEGAAPGSHYTYQMFGDNRIQVTRYVVDGRSDIAGFCIYIEHPWLSPEEYRWSLLKPMTQFVKITEDLQITGRKRKETDQPKIGMNPEKTTKLISPEWTIRYCSKRRRNVMSTTDSGGVVIHQEWSDKDERMKIEKCEECTKEGL